MGWFLCLGRNYGAGMIIQGTSRLPRSPPTGNFSGWWRGRRRCMKIWNGDLHEKKGRRPWLAGEGPRPRARLGHNCDFYRTRDLSTEGRALQDAPTPFFTLPTIRNSSVTEDFSEIWTAMMQPRGWQLAFCLISYWVGTRNLEGIIGQEDNCKKFLFSQLTANDICLLLSLPRKRKDLFARSCCLCLQCQWGLNIWQAREEQQSVFFVFVCLCVCLFVYLCNCVIAYLMWCLRLWCQWWLSNWQGGGEKGEKCVGEKGARL